MEKIVNILNNFSTARRFILISLFVGSIFAIYTPPLWGGDETSHFSRAWQVSQGNMIADKMTYPYGGYSYGDQIPKALHSLIWHTNDDIENDHSITQYGTKRIDNIDSYKQFTSKKLEQPSKDYFFPNTAAYSPIAYLPSAVSIKLAQLFNITLGHTIVLARLAGLIFYIACVAYAINLIRSKNTRWIVFSIALIPTAIFQASTVNVDLGANALSLLLFSLILKSIVDKRLSGWQTIFLFSSAIALPLIKPTYFFISLFIILVPSKALSGKIINPVVVKILTLLMAAFLFAAWTYLTIGVSEEIRRMGIGPRWVLINPDEQLGFVMSHPLAFIKILTRSFLISDSNYIGGLFGQFGFSFIPVPMASIILSLLAIFISLGISRRTNLGKSKLAYLTSVLIVGMFSIFFTLYITFSNVAQPIIEGVQGRYFLPFLPFLALLTIVLNKHLLLKCDISNKKWIFNFITLACLFSLCLACIKFFYVMIG